MGKFSASLAWAVGILLMLGACTKPSTLGSELLEQDQEDVIFSDTFSVRTANTIRDSVVSFNPEGPGTSLTLGYYMDPIFGATKSDMFIQITPGSANIPELEGTVVDSVILSLTLDSINSLGNFDENLQLEVYEMTDSFNQSEYYYSDHQFPTATNVLGTYDGKPSLTEDDSLVISTSESFLGKMIKVRLVNELGARLIDSNVLVDFDENFNGFNIRTTNSTPTESFLSVFAETNGTALTVYYTTTSADDTTAGVYQFLMSPIDGRSNYIERDISGTPLADAINNPVEDEERLYVQGLTGPDVAIDLSSVQDLGPVLVNSAILEFTVADDDGDDRAEHPNLNQLVLAILSADDKFLGIDDFAFGSDFFGGDFDADLDIPNAVQGTYRIFLSDFIQKVIDGEEDPNIFLRALPKINSTHRTVLYGSGVNDYAPKLELTFTRINQ